MSNISYVEALAELQQIVQEIEEGSIDIDQLSEKVKRAAELIGICQNKLYQTELDVQKILNDLASHQKAES